MTIFVIEFDEKMGQFKKVKQELVSEEVADLLSQPSLTAVLTKAHKKYYTVECEAECDSEITQLNARLQQEGELEQGHIRVAECKTCNRLFILKPCRDDAMYKTLPTHCKGCRMLKRTSNKESAKEVG